MGLLFPILKIMNILQMIASLSLFGDPPLLAVTFLTLFCFLIAFLMPLASLLLLLLAICRQEDTKVVVSDCADGKQTISHVPLYPCVSGTIIAPEVKDCISPFLFLFLFSFFLFLFSFFFFLFSFFFFLFSFFLFLFSFFFLFLFSFSFPIELILTILVTQTVPLVKLGMFALAEENVTLQTETATVQETGPVTIVRIVLQVFMEDIVIKVS